MCWSVEILNAWNMLSAGVLIVCSYLCQSSKSYNLAQYPFLGGWGELAKIVLFIPRHTHAREDSFCESAGPLPWQRCCLQPLMSVVSASWHLRNSCFPPASSKSAPFFDFQFLIVMGFLVQSLLKCLQVTCHVSSVHFYDLKYELDSLCWICQ